MFAPNSFRSGPRLLLLAVTLTIGSGCGGNDGARNATVDPTGPSGNGSKSQSSQPDGSRSAASNAETRAAVEQARLFMQHTKYSDAIDALATVDGPEVHYLRAVALLHTGREKLPTALAQIEAAEDAEAENLKYRAARLRIAVAMGDQDAATELVKLFEEHPENPAVAAFSIPALRLWQLVTAQAGNAEAAKRYRDRSIRATKMAGDLSATVPELQPVLLESAISLGLEDMAVSLADRLRKVHPEDKRFDRETVANRARRQNDPKARLQAAVENARREYNKAKTNEEVAFAYAVVLKSAPTETERNKALLDLGKSFPQSDRIQGLVLAGLANTDLFDQALKQLNEVIDRERDPKRKQDLVHLSIAMPIEAEDAQNSRSQLERWRKELGDELLFGYYAGRMYRLQDRPEEAYLLFEKLTKEFPEQLKKNPDLHREIFLQMQELLNQFADEEARPTPEESEGTGQEASPTKDS